MDEVGSSEQTFQFAVQFSKYCFAFIGTHAAISLHQQFGAVSTQTTFTIGLDTQNTKTYTVQWLAIGI